MKAVWSASLPLTPYRGVLNRLSIHVAHCKALGESCLLSHKSSSWGGSRKELWPSEENGKWHHENGKSLP